MCLLRAIQATLAAGAIVLVAAACGGGGGNPGVATVGKESTGTAAAAPAGSLGPVLTPGSAKWQAELLVYAECMRKNGLYDFPDPGPNGQISFNGPFDPWSPQFIAAQRACQHLQPQLSPAKQQQIFANDLKFAECMRAHGVPNYPDPKLAPGQIQTLLPFDPNDVPQFRPAENACNRSVG